MAIFKPSEIIDKFNKLDINKYKKLGFKLVLIDIDNTITIPNTGLFTDEAKQFIENIKLAGLTPVIFSNNTKNRVSRFVDGYDVKWSYWSFKPLPFAYWNQCFKNHCKPSETLVIGDQIMTDILGANISGCYGIYSKQLQEKDTTLTSINRVIEKFIWKYIIHEKM